FARAGRRARMRAGRSRPWRRTRRSGRTRSSVRDNPRLSRRQDLALPGVLRSRGGVTTGGALRVDTGFEGLPALGVGALFAPIPGAADTALRPLGQGESAA